MHVPYRGAAPALTDLMSGQIQAVFTSLPSVIGHIREGAVRPLAVTSAKRAGAAPDVPTIAEFGVPGFDVNPWFGLLAPAGTPPAVVRQINDDVAAALREKDTIERFTGQGAEPLITTPEQFLALLQADVEKWGKVVKASGAKLDCSARSFSVQFGRAAESRRACSSARAAGRRPACTRCMTRRSRDSR